MGAKRFTLAEVSLSIVESEQPDSNYRSDHQDSGQGEDSLLMRSPRIEPGLLARMVPTFHKELHPQTGFMTQSR